jgi:ubiquinone biosynthesis protein UbiJ
VLTQAVENALNQNLAASLRARELCGALRGRRIRIEISGLSIRIGIESVGDSLRLERDPDAEFAAELIGSPVNLLALAAAGSTRLLHSGAVQIRGDAELLERYQELLRALGPDFEEELARLVGDLPAHHLARVAFGMLRFGRRTVRTTVQNTFEYLAHESRDLVPRAEAEEFLTGVDRLREDVDRAAARLAALEARLQKPADSQRAADAR